jgi:hypothetical protein
MIASEKFPVPSVVSLAVIAGILAITVLVSMASSKKATPVH